MSKGKDPAFLFYPGDYLQDTQNLSEKSQVAYDRIMCEHMRNICISYEQHKFFTKRLNDDERIELMMVLTEEKGVGYYIEWVRRSIEKRKEYSKSRSNNRIGKSKPVIKKKKNISKSYDEHMVNGDVNGNESKKESETTLVFPFDTERFREQWKVWKQYKRDQHRFQYKGISEQAALKKLGEDAGNEETAIAIIHQSIQNGWKGFFELKQNGKQNGINNSGSGKFNRDDMEAGLAEVLRQQQQHRTNSH